MQNADGDAVWASATYRRIAANIEHPNFEDYFASKLKIFAQAHISCVNLDCDHAQRVMEAAQAAGAPIITFSQKDPAAQVYASDVHKEDGQILFTLRTPRYTRQMRLTMPGLFNVENALGPSFGGSTFSAFKSRASEGEGRGRHPEDARRSLQNLNMPI